ncbi:hypothetical protein GUJ93_ZPchr0013g35087 [Zizania palustris]|uniref:DUF7880 domain-containing protein n=1 Tax=Zizania palustris TaxID=103762 RepID=A0A8J6C1Q0_ZIZPA|nr:hypothetical protein GUJ93_ZPchr0013g35087 [Zizania palustris]
MPARTSLSGSTPTGYTASGASSSRGLVATLLLGFVPKKSLEFEKPKYDESRSLLRSGPASSLRINIRAVAQYASSNGQGKTASDAVDECLRALEDLDALLLQASRNNPSASVDIMRSKISVALGALDNLLQTVPSAVMDKGKAIADAYRTPADEYEVDNAAELDPRLKQLQDIL